MIRRHVELTQRLAAEVAGDERFEIVAPHPLNLLCLRLVARRATATDDADRAGQRHRRSVLFTRTVLDGEVALRFSIGATATEWRHVAAAWQLLQSLA